MTSIIRVKGVRRRFVSVKTFSTGRFYQNGVAGQITVRDNARQTISRTLEEV